MSDPFAIPQAEYAFMQVLERAFLESASKANIREFYSGQMTSYDHAAYAQNVIVFEDGTVVWLNAPISPPRDILPNPVVLCAYYHREEHPEIFAAYDAAFPERAAEVATLHFGVAVFINNSGEMEFQAQGFEAEKPWIGEDQEPVTSLYFEFDCERHGERAIAENGALYRGITLNPELYDAAAHYFLTAYRHSEKAYQGLSEGQAFDNGYIPQPIDMGAFIGNYYERLLTRAATVSVSNIM